VDDINLLEDDVINILLNAVKEGYVSVEREGISLRYPCRPLLIATYNPEEGELKEHFLDRIGVSLCANAFRLKDEERVQAVDNVMFFTDSAGTKRAEEGKSAIAAAMEKEYDTQASIMFAKELLADVDVSKDQIQYLCEEAIRAGVQGHRADIFALQVAKANAALDGRAQVNARDLTLAVQLAIAPRGTWVEELDGNEESKPMPASASQPAQIPPSPEDHGPTHEDQDEPSDEKDEEQEDSEDDINRHDTELVPDIPEELQFAPDATPIDPKLLHFLSIQRRGKGKGRRNRIFSQVRFDYHEVSAFMRNCRLIVLSPIQNSIDRIEEDTSKPFFRTEKVATSQVRLPGQRPKSLVNTHSTDTSCVGFLFYSCCHITSSRTISACPSQTFSTHKI
jgi:magnesium chelatase subunit D